MIRTCSNHWCKQTFEITDEDVSFYEKVSPVFAGKKLIVPPPTQCPECRMMRRLAYRNDRSLYRSTSQLSGIPMLSMYNPRKGYVVYEQQEWWSNQWEPMSYGRDFDFTRKFFDQFSELQRIVPRFNIFNRDAENCDYVNYAPHCRNCYLTFGSWFNEDCCYGQTLTECKNCLDSLFLEKSELSYECIDCDNCYHSSFCQSCRDCMESSFCYDCKSIKNCFGCWNLRNKEYHLFNRPSSKEEIAAMRSRLISSLFVQEQRKRFQTEKVRHALHQRVTGLNNENCSGDFLFECKNVRKSFTAYRCQDLAYCGRLMEQQDTYDFEGGGKGQLAYESMSNDFCFRSIVGTTCERLSEAHYCDLCFDCEHCFGCIGLRRKKYCIFNKQYSGEEYELLVPRLIAHMQKTGEWGEFFPVSLSPFAYNETMAQEYFPLTEEEVISRGWEWKVVSDETPTVEKIIPGGKLPDSIHDIPDDILGWAIQCEVTKRPFRIVKQELAFYRKVGLPIPHFHPDERHRRRMSLRNPRKLWVRMCGKCGKEMETSYSPDRPEKVYCEVCYLKEVY